jgi:hypothetical protein
LKQVFTNRSVPCACARRRPFFALRHSRRDCRHFLLKNPGLDPFGKIPEFKYRAARLGRRAGKAQ